VSLPREYTYSAFFLEPVGVAGADVEAGVASLNWRGWEGVKATTGFLSVTINGHGGVEGVGAEGGLKSMLYALGRRMSSNGLMAEDHPRYFL
jgi:hypothetical protein